MMVNKIKILMLSAAASCVASAGAQSITIVDRPVAKGQSENYVSNRKPLLQTSFIKLPVGAIAPHGWFKRYLELQRDGLTGNLDQISAWLDKRDNAWLGKGGNAGWEEVPYWLKGYANIGYILGDQKMIDQSRVWLEMAIQSQQKDGYFGPINERNGNRELWANMIMLWCLQSYYEYSGDTRVITLMTNYFRWETTVPDEKFMRDYWENSRVGDNMYSVMWLYNITGDKFLLELCDKLHRCGADWTGDSYLPNWHNVNIAQGFREPATYYLLTHNPAHLAASYNVHNLVRRTFGQVPGGMFGADENARLGYIDPRQGTETCGFVEQMASDQLMLRSTGDPMWAEHCEDVAFNSYPAAVMPDFRSLRYITSPNQVVSDSKNHHPGIDNQGPFLAMNPFSSRCCQHNHAQGWPYMIENLVLATVDNGVGVAMYGACEAQVKVGNGVGITIRETTNYPFDDLIRFDFTTPSKVQFPLYLRVPTWSKGSVVTINGKKVNTPIIAGKYIRIDREWSSGDKVEVRYPMSLAMRTWQANQGSVSVNYGPLTLSLEIKEELKRVDSKASAIGDSKWQESVDQSAWPTWEIYPASAWNYALVTGSGSNPLDYMKVEKRAWPADNFPFTQTSSPIVVRAKGRIIPSWVVDKYNLCGVLPPIGVAMQSEEQDINLVPMGAARLRISAFPPVPSGTRVASSTPK